MAHSPPPRVRIVVMTGVQVVPTAAIVRPEPPQWTLVRLLRTTLHVMLEMGLVAIVTNATTLVTICGTAWVVPFANRADAASLQAFTVWMVTSSSFFGALMVSVLVAFQLRGRQLLADPSQRTFSIGMGAWIAVRLSWKTLMLSAIVPGALVALLFLAGVPLLEYNLHSLIMSIAIIVGAGRMAINVAHFRRTRTRTSSDSPTTAATATQRDTSNAPPQTSRRRPHSWKRSLRSMFLTSVTSTMAVLVMTQYMAIARTVQFHTIHGFFAFSVGSTLIKVAIPLLTKRFVLKNRLRDPFTVFYVVASPIFHVDIQLRMALLRAQQTMPVYLTSAILTAVEILARIVAIAVELAAVRREQRQVEREKTALTARSGSRDDKLVRQQVTQLEERFVQWKRAHYRVCAAEILAEMAAEYCGIGLVTVFVIVLRGNVTIDLPHNVRSTGGGVASTQIKAWATQTMFEILTDVVGVAIETRVGVPLLETIKNDNGKFMRWAAAVVASHASGLCLSSLIGFASTPS